MSLPKTGEPMNSNDRLFTWARFLAPFIVGMLGALIGGYASYRVAQATNMAQFKQQAIDLGKLEQRVQRIEDSQSFVIERMARIETKVDILLER